MIDRTLSPRFPGVRKAMFALAWAAHLLASTAAGAADVTPEQWKQLTDRGWWRQTGDDKEKIYFEPDGRYVHTRSRVRNGQGEHQQSIGRYVITGSQITLTTRFRKCPQHFEGTFALRIHREEVRLSRDGTALTFSMIPPGTYDPGPATTVPGCFSGEKFAALADTPSDPPAPAVAGTAPLMNATERSRWHWTAGDLHGYYDDIENGPLFLWPDGRYALVVPVVAPDMTPDFDATVRNLDKWRYGKYRVLSLGDPSKVGIVFHSAEGGTSEATLVRRALWWRLRGRRERFQVHPATFRELFGTYTRSVSMSTDRGYLPPGTLRVDIDISNSTKVTFGEGRRFRWNSNTVVMTPTSAGDATGSPQQAAFDGTTGTNSTGGSYEIVGTFIVLRFDDGRVERHVFGTSGPGAEYIRIGSRQFSSSQWRVVR